jgi:hypothetical protein
VKFCEEMKYLASFRTEFISFFLLPFNRGPFLEKQVIWRNVEDYFLDSVYFLI